MAQNHCSRNDKNQPTECMMYIYGILLNKDKFVS